MENDYAIFLLIVGNPRSAIPVNELTGIASTPKKNAQRKITPISIYFV